jgi:hypothetical protein
LIIGYYPVLLKRIGQIAIQIRQFDTLTHSFPIGTHICIYKSEIEN